MIQAATNGKNRYEGTSAALKVTESAATGDAARTEYSAVASLEQLADLPQLNRTSPRRSVVLVVSESRSISPDFLVDGLRARGDEQVDVLVACAGQPADLSALQHCIADAQFLLAPAGTSVEDLREMAMAQASGDIVTLVTAPLLSESVLADQPLVRGS
jgi:hypothetical protein